jgi:hypothetical protein
MLVHSDMNDELREGFIVGYNKAKETFYTEEDMKKAFRYGMGIGEWQMKDDFGAWAKTLKHIKK